MAKFRMVDGPDPARLGPLEVRPESPRPRMLRGAGEGRALRGALPEADRPEGGL